MDAKVDTPDSRVARIASRQHGVLSIAQLRMAGVMKGGVQRRVEAGRLYRVHRGVYAVGHPRLSFHGMAMAAALACGAEAAISHRSAAALWGLMNPHGGSIDVAVPNGNGRRGRAGIRLHRIPALRSEHVIRRRGIPVTTPARTVDDLRGSVSAAELRRAIRQAEVLGLPLGSVVGDRTRSELEREFLRLCRRNRLPEPEVNVRIGRHLVDFLWRDRRVVVETDGYRYHRGRQAFEDDRARDLDLRAQGFEVVRLSARQVAGAPGRVAEVLRGVLASGRHRVEPDGR